MSSNPFYELTKVFPVDLETVYMIADAYRPGFVPTPRHIELGARARRLLPDGILTLLQERIRRLVRQDWMDMLNDQ